MGWKGAENNGHLLLKATSTEVVDLSYYGMFLFEMTSLLPLVQRSAQTNLLLWESRNNVSILCVLCFSK